MLPYEISWISMIFSTIFLNVVFDFVAIELKIYHIIPVFSSLLNFFNHFSGIMDDIVAIWDILDINDINDAIREPRRRRIRPNPLIDIPDREFKNRFRFSKTNVRRISDLLRQSLRTENQRGSPFSPEDIVCISLDIECTLGWLKK